MLQFKGQYPAGLEPIITGSLTGEYSSACKLSLSPCYEGSKGLHTLAGASR